MVARHTKLVLQRQTVPLATPVPLTVGQAKQVAAEPVPTMIELLGQTHFLVLELQARALETQLHEKEVALVVVKAVALLQVKHTKVLPVIIIALPAPQSQ